MSIFVSIAAYREPVLRFTLDRARDNARRPDDLHFGIVDQSDLPLEVPANASHAAGARARRDEGQGLRAGTMDARLRRPLGVYGLGSVRTIADFAALSGIDYARRRVEVRAYEPIPVRSAGAVGVNISFATTTATRSDWSG